MEEKQCLLFDDRICDDCGECERCDIDREKLCDNCMKCIRTSADYGAIEIDEVLETDETPGDN